MNHFYAVSRTDLPLHQQAIQSAHAQLEFARLHPQVFIEDHPPFVWLSVIDQIDLLMVKTILVSHGIDVAEFHDKDYKDYNPSAIAFVLPEEKRYLVSKLPLWDCYPKDSKKVGIWRWL